MKRKVIVLILFCVIFNISDIESKASSNMYSQSINIGDDGTEYIPQQEPILYNSITKEPVTAESEALNVSQEQLPVAPYQYYDPYQYVTPQYIRYLPSYPVYPYSGYTTGINAGINYHKKGEGMVVHTNVSGHGYNYGGTGTWVSRPVNYPNRTYPINPVNRPNIQPPPNPKPSSGFIPGIHGARSGK